MEGNDGNKTGIERRRETQFSSTNQPKRRKSKHVKTAILEFLRVKAEEKGLEDPIDIIGFCLVEMVTERTFNGQLITYDQRLRTINTILDRLEGRPNVRVDVNENKVIANLAWINGETPIQEAIQEQGEGGGDQVEYVNEEEE